MAERNEHPLEELFRPRSIAVVGASADPTNMGRTWLEVLTSFQFPGPLYAVNPAFSEVAGLRCYPHLEDISGPVDYVISCIPASLVPKLLDECIQKGVKLLHLFTGRMAESGEKDRTELEARIGERARQGGVRILGPNCMGLYYPGQSISYSFGFPREAGAVGYFAQSGSHTNELVGKASLRGARFSQVVSFGNALDINECDLLEHFAQDPATKVIAIYIEGVKDGRRFFQLLKEITPQKPVLIHKGGHSGAGARAAFSHTAALAGDEQIWDALFRQTGVIPAYSADDLADLVIAFLFLPPPRGRRVAVIGGAGGYSVQAADDCDLAGLVVPPLSPEIQRQLQEIAPQTSFLLRNPVDTSALGNRAVLPKIVRTVAEWNDTDLLLGLAPDMGLGRPSDRTAPFETLNPFLEAHQLVPHRPMVLVTGYAETAEEWRWQISSEKVAKASEARIPVYPHVSRAARALSRFCLYHEFLASRRAE